MKRTLAFVFVVATLVPSLAQAQGVRFRGVVTDEEGNPVAGATVKVQVIALDTSISGTGKSKKDGRYGLFVMQPARQYRISVTKAGYDELVEDFDAGSGWTKEHIRVERDFVLKKGSGKSVVQLPQDVQGIYNKGIEAFNKRNWEEARARFESALKIRPRLAQVHFVLAQTCVFQGDNDQALASAERAVELDPDHREGIELLMKIHRGLGNDERADDLDRQLEELELEPEG